ncbi:MFS transporter [Actinoplanes couchii]|nr:MFS transporter [Actinoplanes couchii]MDR6318739.1 DHA2 family multidrug resistance protein-like MFS transporter [Actinoplanes couchii]
MDDVASASVRGSTNALSARRRWAALAVLTLAVTLLAIDGTVLALAVPSLTAALEPTTTQLLWIGDIYSFALAGLLVTMGNLADRIGRRRLLLIGSVAFGLSSAIAAFAPTAELLIAARLLLGISGATIMPSTLSIVRNLFDDPQQRTRAIAIWSAGATAGAALGPLAGGALLEHFWWGSVFLVNLPVMVIVVVLGLWLLPESRNPQRPTIDWPSAALSLLAIVPLVYAVKHTISAQFDGQSIAAAGIGLLAAAIFVRRQRRLPQPLLDVELFANPAFTGAIAAAGTAIFAFSGLLFFFSQYLQLVRDLSPLKAGLVELPTTIASIGVVVVVAILMRRLGPGRAIAAGLATAAAGLALLTLALGHDGYVGIVIGLTIIGLGVGVAMTLSNEAVVTAAPKGRAGAAASVAETTYELGLALGIAVLGSVQAIIYGWNLTLPSGTPENLRDAASESLAVLLRHSDSSEALTSGAITAAQDAFAGSVQTTIGISSVLVLLAAVIAWRLIPSPRHRHADQTHP